MCADTQLQYKKSQKLGVSSVIDTAKTIKKIEACHVAYK